MIIQDYREFSMIIQDYPEFSMSLWDPVGVTLRSLRSHFGVILGSLWGHFGDDVGSTFGVTPDRFWSHPGPKFQTFFFDCFFIFFASSRLGGNREAKSICTPVLKKVILAAVASINLQTDFEHFALTMSLL